MHGPPVFNQALVRFDDDDRVTAAVAAAVQIDGRCWVGATKFRGRTVIRLSLTSWQTTPMDVEAAARAIVECAAVVRAQGGAEGRVQCCD